MLDWCIGTRLEGEQFVVTEDEKEDQQYQDNFEEGKCSKGP